MVIIYYYLSFSSKMKMNKYSINWKGLKKKVASKSTISFLRIISGGGPWQL